VRSIDFNGKSRLYRKSDPVGDYFSRQINEKKRGYTLLDQKNWNEPTQILFAYNDSGAGNLARSILENSGFKVVLAEDGEQVLEIWKKRQFDLILLDTKLPVPERLETNRQNLVNEDLNLDLKSRRLQRGGRDVPLSPIEFSLLKYFMQHTGEVISKEKLLRQVWGQIELCGDHNQVETAIRRLRRKIEENPKEPHYLQTIWGAGYCFCPNPNRDRQVTNDPGLPPRSQ
jgi:DNA-binding response OmpR family regulator